MLTTTTHQYPFLEGGGELGELIRQYDWSQSALGAPDTWPQSLRTTLSIILNSKFPMFLFWGEEHICFYNDAYRPSLGNNGKHPYAIGKPGVDVWPEIWSVIKPLIDQVLSGHEATWSEDQLIPIYRNGQLEDVYWTFSYSPVRDESGSISGVFVTCSETTQKVLNMRQLAESRDLLGFAIEATELGIWDLNPITNKFTANERLKEWFGFDRLDSIDLDQALSTIADWDRLRVRTALNQAIDYTSGGAFSSEFTIIHPETDQERVVRAKGKVWFTDEQTPYRFNGTLQDITSERKAQHAEHAAQQLAELAIKSAGIGLFRVNIQDDTIEYSPAYSAIITGDPTKKSFSRHDFTQYVHPEDRLIRDEAKKVGLETGDFYYQVRVIWDDGSLHYIRVMGGLIRNETGQPIAYSGTVRDITEPERQIQALREAELQFASALRQREALFSSVSNSSPTGLWLCNEQGSVTYLNNTLINWIGLPYEDLLGDGWSKALVEEDRQRSEHALLNAIANHSHYEVLFRLRKKDGTVVWCRSAGDPYFNEDGTYAGYAGYCLDIDELVTQGEALQQSEAKFRSLIEEAPVATCLFVGRELRVEVANDVMLGYWGKDASILGLPLTQAVPELKDQPFLTTLDEVFTTGQTYESRNTRTVLQRHGTLSTYYFDFTYKPLRNEAGEVYAIMDMAVDVTAEVVSRQQIDQAEATLRGAIELAELATWNYDVINKVLTYSDRLKHWFGFQDDETIYTTRYNPVDKSDQELVKAAITKALTPQSGGMLHVEFTSIAYRTGRKRILRTQGKTQFDEFGQPIRVTGTAQDITEQRQLQLALEQQVQQRTEELEAANEELKATNEELASTNEEIEEANGKLIRSNENLEKFAYVASHDLQEPLRKVQQFGDLLQRQFSDQLGEGVVYVQRMQLAANRMSTLIRDLLSFSRIATQRQAVKPIPLADVIQTVLTDLELRVQETGAVIDIQPMPTLYADPTQLGQLFQNLLSNALKFQRADESGMPIAPAIQVSSQLIRGQDLPAHIRPSRRAAAYYRINVSDNGIGFDEKYLDRIFQVFQRLHGKNEFAGTGIGLAICEKVVANHGGAISATSKPGQGATFHVYLPLIDGNNVR